MIASQDVTAIFQRGDARAVYHGRDAVAADIDVGIYFSRQRSIAKEAAA